MNLYSVSDCNYEWCCFVFDTSRNRAKMRVAKYFDMDYIDMRCKLCKRGVNISMPMIVDDETSDGYDVVLNCGYHYLSEDKSIIDEILDNIDSEE